VIVDARSKTVMLALAAALHAGLAAAQPAQRPYTLTVTKDATPFVTLKAKDAKLAEVAADLGRQLATKVIVGASLKDQTISADFAGTPVEPAMLAIAPRVYVDYELRRDAPPKALGIYLLGNDDIEPARTAVVQGTSQGLFVEGNTEDTGQPPANAPLRIHYDKGRLTVFAKQQLLLAVVMSMAEQLGVPAEIKYETREVIDADIKETSAVEEAFTSLSDLVRVYVRVDPTRVERTLLRVVIDRPAAR